MYPQLLLNFIFLKGSKGVSHHTQKTTLKLQCAETAEAAKFVVEATSVGYGCFSESRGAASAMALAIVLHRPLFRECTNPLCFGNAAPFATRSIDSLFYNRERER